MSNDESNNSHYSLYERIEEELIYRNMSIRDMLKETNMSYHTLKKLKERKPTTKTYLKISQFLNESPHDVLKYQIK